jgi:HEAT repeat protein
MSTETVVEAMVAAPWDADDLVKPLSKNDRAAVRKALLARAAKTPERYAVSALGAFRDAETIALLQKLLANKKLGSGPHVGAAVALTTMETPAADKVLAGLLTHPVESVVRAAVESIQGKPAAIVKTLLPMIDAIAKRGDDLLMCDVVEKLVAAAPQNKDVIAALAKHWEFSVKHGKTLMGSNAIFDALIEHAPDSPVAQAMFVAAVASGHEYGIVRGRAALALTGRDTATHVKELKKMKGLAASSSSFRVSALKRIGKRKKS